jgi:hypothetical protein
MKCPKCESDDVLLCSVAVAQGTTTTQTKGHSEGGADGIGRVTSEYSGTQTTLTEFAKRAAAPTPRLNGAIGMVAFAIIAYVVVPAAWRDLAHHTPPGWLNLVLLAAIAWSIYNLVNIYRHRSEDEALHAAWERSWICKRCGTIFDPSEQAPGITQAK